MTEKKQRKKMGRPQLGARKLTEAEKKQRQRLRELVLTGEMKQFGYVRIPVYFDPRQLAELAKLAPRVDIPNFDVTEVPAISTYVFLIIMEYLKREREIHPDLVSESLPELSFHNVAKVNAILALNELEKKMLEKMNNE